MHPMPNLAVTELGYRGSNDVLSLVFNIDGAIVEAPVPRECCDFGIGSVNKPSQGCVGRSDPVGVELAIVNIDYHAHTHMFMVLFHIDGQLMRASLGAEHANFFVTNKRGEEIDDLYGKKFKRSMKVKGFMP